MPDSTHTHNVTGKTAGGGAHGHNVAGATETGGVHQHGITSGVTDSQLSAAQSIMPPYRGWYFITYVGT